MVALPVSPTRPLEPAPEGKNAHAPKYSSLKFPSAPPRTTSKDSSGSRVSNGRSAQHANLKRGSGEKSLSDIKNLDNAQPHTTNSEDGYDSDSSQKSTCSNVSHTSRTSVTSIGGQSVISALMDQRKGSANKWSPSASVCSNHFSIDETSSISIEQEKGGNGKELKVMREFSELAQLGRVDEGLMQSLQMYGFEKPKKLQQHAIPAISQSLGCRVGDQVASASGKSCVVIQGPERSGKTLSMVLSLLAAIDTSVPHMQAILLTSSGKRDFEKYLNVLTQSVTYQSFLENDEQLDLNSQEVEAAHAAHVLIGHPKQILRLLSGAQNLRLDFVRVLVVDDAEDIIYDAQELTPKAPSHLSPVGAETLTPAAALPRCSWKSSPKKSPSSQSRPQPQRKPLVDDVIQIRNVLESRIRSGNSGATHSGRRKIKHVILTQPLADEASNKVLRLLRTSLMQKKNLVKDAVRITPPAKLIKSMKHYYVAAPKGEWVRVLSGLVQTLMFPSALVYCDQGEKHAKRLLDDMNKNNLSVSANLPGAPDPEKSRRQAIKDFVDSKSQFFLTHSESSVLQMDLPKVSCVFHMDVPNESPSTYGSRLLPLEEKTAKNSVSVLFVEPQDKKTVAEIEKLFDVHFMEMPFDFIPESSSAKQPALPSLSYPKRV